jgi:hypothetical protein
MRRISAVAILDDELAGFVAGGHCIDDGVDADDVAAWTSFRRGKLVDTVDHNGR